METKVNFTLVGVFVLALSAALIAGVIWLSTGAQIGKKYDSYYCYIRESVSGLNMNAPVRYRGVIVGKVIEIELDHDSSDQVRLKLQIERGTPLKEDTVATLRSQGLTGISFVELTGGSRNSPLLRVKKGEKYAVIPSGPSLFTRLDSAVSEVLSRMDQSLANLNSLLNEKSRRDLQVTLASLATVTRTLASRSGSIDSSLKNAAVIMDNGARVSATLPELLRRLDKSSEEIGQLAQDAGKTNAEARKMFANANDALPQIESLLVQMRDLSTTLNRLAQELENNPNALLYGNSPHAGPGE